MQMTETEFETLATEYNCIPLYKEIIADTETPVSVLQRFADNDDVFLLESMEGGETWGRYSFIGVNPKPFLDVDHRNGRTNALNGIRDLYRGNRVAPIEGLPRFFGGAVGFLGYESIGEFEKMPDPKDGPRPISRFVQVSSVIVFDNVRHTIKIVVCAFPEEHDSAGDAYRTALDEIRRIEKALEAPLPEIRPPSPGQTIEFSSNMEPEQFLDMIGTAKKYIYDGDIIQVVLSQRFSTETDIHPFHLYRALRHLNPSPYTFFLKTGSKTLVGSSPEVMVRLTDRCVEVRPIAGTRPRGETPEEDKQLEQDLLQDQKERAEHVMLVDLGRNDIGRIAEAGSVDVTEYMVIEHYSHVMHMGFARRRNFEGRT